MDQPGIPNSHDLGNIRVKDTRHCDQNFAADCLSSDFQILHRNTETSVLHNHPWKSLFRIMRNSSHGFEVKEAKVNRVLSD